MDTLITIVKECLAQTKGEDYIKRWSCCYWEYSRQALNGETPSSADYTNLALEFHRQLLLE